MRLNLYVSFSEPFRFLLYDENEIVEAEQLDCGSTLQIWFAILYPTRSYMNFCLTWTYYWEKFPKINNLVFLIATWNLNLINHHCHKATSDFLDLLYSRMFFPLITRPTRITANKVSLIANIFTNNPLRPSISGLFLNDISDHSPIFSLILCNNSTNDKAKYVIFVKTAESKRIYRWAR